MSPADVNLLDLPCYIINLRKNTARWKSARARAIKAGFKNIIRFDAIDGRNPRQLAAAWRSFPENFLENNGGAFKNWKGVQGCYLSHMMVWQLIAEMEQAAAVVFEDDIVFHEHWHDLWPKYWSQTPADFDNVYMGGYVREQPASLVAAIPVLCNHASVISCAGATKMRDYIVTKPPNHVDHILHALQLRILLTGQFDLFNWYVWFARTNKPLKNLNPYKYTGLVFQDREFLSDNY